MCGRASTRCESINIGAVGRNQALFSRCCDWDTHALTSSRSANGVRRNQRRRRVEGAANGFGCCCGCRCSMIIVSIRLHVRIPDLRVTLDSSRTQEPTGLPALASSRSSQHGLHLAAVLDIFLQTAAVCCPACKKVVTGSAVDTLTPPNRRVLLAQHQHKSAQNQYLSRSLYIQFSLTARSAWWPCARPASSAAYSGPNAFTSSGTP